MEKNNLEECENPMFRAIAKAANDAIILMNEKGTVAFWNSAAERIFGYKSEEIIGKDLHETLTPIKYRALQNKNFEKFVRTGTGNAIGKTVEVEAIRKDGEEFPVELSLAAIKLNGKWNAIGIVRDISKRKKLEGEILNQKEKYDTLLKNINDLVFETDGKGRIIYANNAVEKFLDKPKSEIYGSKIYKYFDRKSLFIIINEFEKYKNYTGDPVFLSHELKLKNGKIVQINVTVIFNKNGIYNIFGVARDITQQKENKKELDNYRNNLEKLLEEKTNEIINYKEHLEELVEERTLQLKESEKKYSNLLDNSDDPIIQINEHLQFIYVNNKAIEITQIPREEFIGKTCFDLGFKKEVSEKMRSSVKYVFENKEKIRVELETPNQKWLDFSFVPEFDSNGNVISVLATGRDITDRRKKEMELKKKSEELELFNKTMINREMRIIELKKEVNSFAEKLGEPKPYPEIWENEE